VPPTAVGGSFSAELADSEHILILYVASQLFTGTQEKAVLLLGHYEVDESHIFSYVTFGEFEDRAFPLGETTITAALPEPGTVMRRARKRVK
jgi:hypothetical protein